MEIPREHQHHLSEGPVPDWIVRHPVPPPGRLDGSAAQAALLFDHQFHVENGTYFRRCAYFLPNSLSVQTGSRIEIGFAPDSEHLILHEIVIRRGNEVIAAHAGQELRVLHREAQMERFTFDGRLLAVILLNDVRVGDIVDYSFSHRATREPLFGRIFGRFNLRGEINVEAVRNRLVYQTGRTIYAVPHNWEIPAHAVYTADGLIDSRWDANQVERCEIEPRTPLSAIPHGWIDYGEFATWDEVAEAEARLYPPADEPLPPPMAEWVAQVQTALPSPDQFVTHLLRYVQEDIRYVSVSIDEHTHAPYPVSTILERRFGDCKDKSVLLCRLLREAGYDATPALVHTQLRGKSMEGLPRPFAFNHAIVRLQLQDQTHWLDPTLLSQGGRLGAIWIPPYGRALLVRAPDGNPVVEKIPATSSPHSVTCDEFVKIRLPDGSAELRLSRVLAGEAADKMRLYLAQVGLPEADRELVASYKQDYRTVQLIGAGAYKDDRDKNEISIVHNFALADLWLQIKGPRGPFNRAGFPVRGIRQVLLLPERETSRYPYRIKHPIQIRASMDIRLTAAFRPHRKQGVIESPAFQCKFFHENSSNSCRVNLEYASTSFQVAAGALPKHANAIRQVAEYATMYVTTAWNQVSKVRRA